MAGVTPDHTAPVTNQSRQGLPMKALMPLIVATPPFIHGGLALTSRRKSNQAYRRSMMIGLAFNICYLIAVGVACAVLYME